MRFDGRPLEEVSAIEVLRAQLSPAAFELIAEGMGYTCILDEAIGAANIVHTDLGSGSLLTLEDGMQALPLALGARFREVGGTVALDTTLRRIERTLGEDYRLVLDGPEGPAEVRARHVVLAMPARALRLIEDDGLLSGSETFTRDVDAVVPVPARGAFGNRSADPPMPLFRGGERTGRGRSDQYERAPSRELQRR